MLQHFKVIFLKMRSSKAQRNARNTSQQLNTSCLLYLFFLLTVQKMPPLAEIKKCFFG